MTTVATGADEGLPRVSVTVSQNGDCSSSSSSHQNDLQTGGKKGQLDTDLLHMRSVAPTPSGEGQGQGSSLAEVPKNYVYMRD